MASNGSNLVFDLSDPSPRFEFSDPSPSKTGGNKKLRLLSKKGRVGFGNKKVPSTSSLRQQQRQEVTGGSSSLNGSPDSKKSTGTATTAASSTATATATMMTSSSTRLNLPDRSSLPNHNRAPSDYLSEASASEFSFDRVTVTTAEYSTGYMSAASSNVSWNFLEDGGIGLGDAAAGGAGNFVPYTGDTPVAVNASPATASAANCNNVTAMNQQQTGSNINININATPKSTSSHIYNFDTNTADNNKQRQRSSFDFSECSSTDLDEIPVANFISSNMSAISEISGVLDDGSDILDNDINDIQDQTLRDQLLAAQLHNKKNKNKGMGFNYSNTGTGSPVSSPERKTRKSGSSNSHSKTTTNNGEDSHGKRSKSFLEDMQESYNYFINNRKSNAISTVPQHHSSTSQTASVSKTKSSSSAGGAGAGVHAKNNTTSSSVKTKHIDTSSKDDDKNNKTTFTSLLDDIYFCGWYFCGIDPDNIIDKNHKNNNTNNTSTANGGGGNTSNNNGIERTKDDRKKEAEQTFLGKIVACRIVDPCIDAGTMACRGGGVVSL